MAERVSFKVAKAIKEAGYPQNIKSTVYYSSGGYLCTDGSCNYVCAAPYAMDVWLWLWQKKKYCIGILLDDGNCAVEIWHNKSFMRDFESKSDPEEAIISAIEHIVDNDLLK